MTLTERFELLAARSNARGPLDPDAIGQAALNFSEHGQAPADPELLAAVLDLEEACSLALGADPAGEWLQFIDALRIGAPGLANDLRNHVVAGGMSVLQQMRIGKPGACAVKVLAAVEAQ
tara:strand:- start:84 stop:443 length:360 start_codon:yes stop_codon:yes gene_type:complete